MLTTWEWKLSSFRWEVLGEHEENNNCTSSPWLHTSVCENAWQRSTSVQSNREWISGAWHSVSFSDSSLLWIMIYCALWPLAISQHILLDPGKYSQSSPVQSVLDHVHQFKLALLLDWQDADEGLVEHSSFRQLGDDLGGLWAAWWWHVDLLGELDVAVLHSKECLVGSHSHL